MVQILRDGCAHMRQAFDIESINLDELIATALDDPKAVGADTKAFHGINFADLNTAYHQFCKNETVAKPVVDLGQVIEFFNNAAADLPDQTRLKDKKLPGMSVVLDGKGQTLSPTCSSPATAASGCRSAIFPITCRRRSSPPKTGASISTTASTSAASSAPSSAISPSPGGRRAVRPSPSRW